MAPPDRDTQLLLAGEYVLGTLRGEERAEFESWLKDDIWLQQAVEKWELRLAPLAEAQVEKTGPVTPPAGVWERIEQEVGPGRRRTSGITSGRDRATSSAATGRRPGFWSGFGAAAALASMLLAALVVIWSPWQGAEGPGVTRIAVLATNNGKATLALTFRPGDTTANVTRIAADPPPAGRAHELWIIPAGGKPQSLGVIGNRRVVPIPAAVRAAVGTAAFAVSVEPAGGSTTGAPTGPVIWVGKPQPVANP